MSEVELPVLPNRNAYGRRIRIDVELAKCDVCERSAVNCISVDVSDGEYCTAYICAECAPKLFTSTIRSSTDAEEEA